MPRLPISCAVEGPTDAAVLRSVIRHAGGHPGPVYGLEGKPALLQRLAGYNRAAQFAPWVVLVDLDRSADCAPPARDLWLPRSAPLMCFRVAVRQVEAWLLADAERFAAWFGLKESAVPSDPESLPDAKAAAVNLIRRSCRAAIRADMAPRTGSGRAVGPAYTSRLIEFVDDPRRGWRPSVAEQRADSLQRCIRCLRRLSDLPSGGGLNRRNLTA